MGITKFDIVQANGFIGTGDGIPFTTGTIATNGKLWPAADGA